MNIIEAIKSGKPFRRRAHIPGTKAWLAPLDENKDWNNYFRLDDIMADDWEVESEPVTITREQFDQAYVRAVAKLPSNSTTKVLIDMIAEELNL